MSKDARALREEAAAAAAAGKHKRALAAYLELERLEPRDAQWAKRAGETYRRLGNNKSAVDAFERSADRYAQNGFLVQAIAVCKLILQIDPKHETTLQKLARMNEQVGQGPTRAQGMADANPTLYDSPNVAALRRTPSITSSIVPAAGTGSMPTMKDVDDLDGKVQDARRAPSTPPPVATPRTRTPSAPPTGGRAPSRTSTPPLSVPRTKSKPIQLPPGTALDSVTLAKEVADAYEHSQPGVHVIPIDDEYATAYAEAAAYAEDEEPVRPSMPVIEVEAPEEQPIEAEIDEHTELELEDIEEIPLPEPRAVGLVAQRALAATPLFAGLPKELLEALVAELTLVSLEPGQILFHENDPGDSLYVVAEGEVAVQAEGPPRVEMARLGPGSFIGEVALLTEQPRSATVTAIETSELLRIDRHMLTRVLANHGDMLVAVLRFVRDRLVDRWMRTSPLFRPFTDAERVELAQRFKVIEIEAETVLVGAGKKPDGLYIVLAGGFYVRRGGAAMAHLGPGDLIGETALLSGGAFRSDVVSKGKSLLLYLPAGQFREMIMTHPHVLEYIGELAEHSRRLQIL